MNTDTILSNVVERTSREQIKKDLTYWGNKKEHFEKTHNREGIKASNAMLDLYLDAFNKIP